MRYENLTNLINCQVTNKSSSSSYIIKEEYELLISSEKDNIIYKEIIESVESTIDKYYDFKIFSSNKKKLIYCKIEKIPSKNIDVLFYIFIVPIIALLMMIGCLKKRDINIIREIKIIIEYEIYRPSLPSRVIKRWFK